MNYNKIRTLRCLENRVSQKKKRISFNGNFWAMLRTSRSIYEKDLISYFFSLYKVNSHTFFAQVFEAFCIKFSCAVVFLVFKTQTYSSSFVSIANANYRVAFSTDYSSIVKMPLVFKQRLFLPFVVKEHSKYFTLLFENVM